MTAFKMAFPALRDAGPTGQCAVFHIVGTPLGVRRALRDMFANPLLANLSQDARGNAELVFAEALNNIVEHAYAGGEGPIELRIHRAREALLCDVLDAGLPMPNSELPAGLAQTIGTDQDLPEGGFGWFLIRTLTEDLQYHRQNDCNHLSFQLIIEQ